jgi:hypothetical protein
LNRNGLWIHLNPRAIPRKTGSHFSAARFWLMHPRSPASKGFLGRQGHG